MEHILCTYIIQSNLQDSTQPNIHTQIHAITYGIAKRQLDTLFEFCFPVHVWAYTPAKG